MHPVVEGLAADGIVYRGVLYAGLMITDGRPKVLEFNVRFGDPECQVLMLRLRSDLIDLIEAVLDGYLVGCRPEWDPRPSAGVVLAADGYPGEPAKGDVIHGLDRRAPSTESAVFHAGTARRGADVVTSGGRVLTVGALGTDLRAAVANAYAAVAGIELSRHALSEGHRTPRARARREEEHVKGTGKSEAATAAGGDSHGQRQRLGRHVDRLGAAHELRRRPRGARALGASLARGDRALRPRRQEARARGLHLRRRRRRAPRRRGLGADDAAGARRPARRLRSRRPRRAPRDRADARRHPRRHARDRQGRRRQRRHSRGADPGARRRRRSRPSSTPTRRRSRRASPRRIGGCRRRWQPANVDRTQGALTPSTSRSRSP